ncbi:MAG: hypothetical protein R3B98_06210 [Hyphomonas sp.]
MSETQGEVTTAAAERDRHVGWDDMLEDVFGLNIRAGKTVWELFSRPGRVFAAARTPDWANGTYTPSVRVFFSIIAVILLFKFIWAGEDSAVRESFEAMVEPLREVDPRLATPEVIARMMDRHWVVYPFAVAVCQFAAAAAVFVWGKGTPFISRLRLYFAGIIPSTALSLPVSILLAFVPQSLFLAVSFMTLLIVPTVDGLTVWRGLKGVHAGSGRVWRAILFGFVTITISLFATIVAQFATGLSIGYETAKEFKAQAAAMINEPERTPVDELTD